MEKNNLTGLSRRELERLLNLSDCAMFTAKKTPNIDVEYANKKFYALLQYTPQEYVEKFEGRFMDVILPEEKQRVRALIARQAAAGGSLHLELRAQKKGGAVCWLSLTAQTVEVDGEYRYYCSCVDITQQKKALDDVYSAKREAELLTNNIPGGVIKVRVSDFMILYANDGFYRLAGYNRVEYLSLFGNRCNLVLHPDDEENVQGLVRSAVENRGALGFEYRITAKNGETRWSYINGCRVDDQNGEIVYLCIIMDITARKLLEQRLEENARRSKYLLEYTKETEWTYQIAQRRLHRSGYLEGTYSPEEQIDNLFEEERMREFVHPEDIKPLLTVLLERIKRVGSGEGVYRIKDAKGDYRTCAIRMISVAPAKGEMPDVIYGTTRLLEDNSYMLPQDTAQPAQKDNKILALAESAQAKYGDEVTGLMAYGDFKKEVEQQLADREDGIKCGVLCCDIDGFQRFNYHYGISIGNEVLKGIAQILGENMAYQNICSRVSGDYFIAFFKYERHSELLKRISHMLQLQEKAEEGKSYRTAGTTSGIYLIQDEDTDIMQILENADLARRSIKGTRGNHYAIYTDELQNSRFWEDEMVQEIEQSIINHTIEICYLPRIRGTKENVIGSKAVPRVPLKNGDYLPLEDLRRFVERSETVRQLVFYVMTGVCGNLGAWKANGKKVLPVSIDITANQLCMKNAVNKLDDIVKKNKLEPKDIIFEIQEHYFSELTTDFELALKDLSERGYRVIISRFGSEHTAVHSLRRFPVAGIKFHGEYFNRSLESEKEKVIFSRLVEMVKALGLEAGCGGIQTQLQENVARSIGCEVLEGDIYYGTMRSEVYEKCFL